MVLNLVYVDLLPCTAVVLEYSSCVYTAVVISCLIGRFISRMKARFRSGRLDQT